MPDLYPHLRQCVIGQATLADVWSLQKRISRSSNTGSQMGQAFANKLRSASPYERCDIKCPAEIYTKAESTRGIASNGGLYHSRPNEAFQSERLPTNPGEF